MNFKSTSCLIAACTLCLLYTEAVFSTPIWAKDAETIDLIDSDDTDTGFPGKHIDDDKSAMMFDRVRKQYAQMHVALENYLNSQQSSGQPSSANSRFRGRKPKVITS